MRNWSKRKTRFFLTVFFVLLFSILILTGNLRCYTKLVTGIPCPGCGMTRAWLSCLRLDFREAFFYHPLFLLPPVILLLLFLQKKKIFTTPKWLWGVLIVLFLGVYGIRMYLYFPSTAPMTYDPEAIFPRLMLQFSKLWAMLSSH